MIDKERRPPKLRKPWTVDMLTTAAMIAATLFGFGLLAIMLTVGRHSAVETAVGDVPAVVSSAPDDASPFGRGPTALGGPFNRIHQEGIALVTRFPSDWDAEASGRQVVLRDPDAETVCQSLVVPLAEQLGFTARYPDGFVGYSRDLLTKGLAAGFDGGTVEVLSTSRLDGLRAGAVGAEYLVALRKGAQEARRRAVAVESRGFGKAATLSCFASARKAERSRLVQLARGYGVAEGR